MSDWQGLREFLALAETSSFSAAAERLGVSQSHVSRQLRRLEDRLGVKLVSRSTRVVRLTDAGEDYRAQVGPLATGIDEADARAAGRERELSGTIRVSVGGHFAETRVAPALAEFAKQHPKISIDMDFNSRNVDLIEEGFDFAVRYGALADSSLVARRLSGRVMACVAAPSYLETMGQPATPKELRSHDCLVTNSDTWVFHDPATGRPLRIKVAGPWRSNSVLALRAAVLKGLGVAYVPVESLEDDIQAGMLKVILSGFEDRRRANWLLYPENRYLPLRVRCAMDHLIDSLG